MKLKDATEQRKRGMAMPQSERSAILKEILKWLNIPEFEKGKTVAAILAYTKLEITELGATDNTIKKYIQDLDHSGLIEYKHPNWKITELGRKWLERHGV